VSKTPILDCEEPVPEVRTRKYRFRGLTIGVIGGLALGFCLSLNHKRLQSLPARSWLLFVLAFYVVVLVHELGHVVVGLAVNFELRGVGVGAFELIKERRGFRFRFVPRRAFGGGFTMMVPRSTEGREARRLLWMILGGPVASLLLLLLTLLMPWNILTVILLGVNLLVSLTSWIPYSIRGQPSDAKSILILVRKGPLAEQFAAIRFLIALNARGVKPRDWPPELLAKINVPAKENAVLPGVLLFRFSSALNGSDRALIAETLENALAWSHEISPEQRKAFFVDAAYFQGIFRNNAGLARTWVRRAHTVKRAVSRKNWDSKALAGVAYAEGKQDQVREHLERYIADLDQCASSGMIAAERVHMVKLMNQVSAVSDR
jgi:hypothetical protein